MDIDSVIYFQVTDPRAATYEIANYIQAVEQLTITTLRNVVGALNLEQTLTSRDEINTKLRGELDDATGQWGIRVARVELKAIDPPPSIQDAMEKQMRADRDKRAIILQSEGASGSPRSRPPRGRRRRRSSPPRVQKQSAILAAEAERQSRILRAEGERAARYLAAQGQAKAIETVFASIHASDPDPELLAYQYLQTLPQIAQGDANKIWIVPSEFSKALEGLAGLTGASSDGSASPSWLTEAAKSPGGRPTAPKETLDTSDWFDSKLPPARLQPEAEIRASDRDSETAAAHARLSYDPPDGQDDLPDEDDGPRALPPTPAQYTTPATGPSSGPYGEPSSGSAYPGRSQPGAGQPPTGRQGPPR